MKTIRIARAVKYKKTIYPANTDIQVEDSDVTDMLSRGGWVINKGGEDTASKVIETSEKDESNFLQDVIVEKLKEEVSNEPVRKKVKKTH